MSALHMKLKILTAATFVGAEDCFNQWIDIHADHIEVVDIQTDTSKGQVYVFVFYEEK